MLHFVFVDLYVDGCIPVLYSQSFRVLSKFDQLVDCYSILATTSIFPEQYNLICGFICVSVCVCIYNGVNTNIVGRHTVNWAPNKL